MGRDRRRQTVQHYNSTLLGRSISNCMFPSLGVWSSEVPRCDLYGCVAPYLPYSTLSPTIILPLGVTSQITCQPGYNVIGPDTIRCLNTGHVELSEESMCVPVTCPLFKVLYHVI